MATTIPEQRLTDIEAEMSRLRARLEKLESTKPIILTVEVHTTDSDVEIEAAVERAKAEKGVPKPTYVVLLTRFSRD